MVIPIIVINLKTYHSGKKSLQIAKAIEQVTPKAIVGVQPTDIHMITTQTRLQVYCEHVDEYKPGRNTGYVLPEAAKGVGAKGAFLNHSEHRIPFDTLKKTIARCRKVGLKTLVFAKNLQEAKKIAKLKPTHIAIEPPELVAGNTSVTNAKPGLIKKIATELQIPFLIGAGIKTKADITKATELGAAGVAFSSILTKAKNPKKTLRQLTQ